MIWLIFAIVIAALTLQHAQAQIVQLPNAPAPYSIKPSNCTRWCDNFDDTWTAATRFSAAEDQVIFVCSPGPAGDLLRACVVCINVGAYTQTPPSSVNRWSNFCNYAYTDSVARAAEELRTHEESYPSIPTWTEGMITPTGRTTGLASTTRPTTSRTTATYPLSSYFPSIGWITYPTIAPPGSTFGYSTSYTVRAGDPGPTEIDGGGDGGFRVGAGGATGAGGRRAERSWTVAICGMAGFGLLWASLW